MTADLTGAKWIKSTRSSSNGACVEVALNIVGAEWRKSSRSAGNGQCVEVAGNLAGVVGVRDSKDPAGPALVVHPTAFEVFAAVVKSGRLDG